ncbi:fructose-6-phosphate aldolase [Dethiobacter alkaliphilus]|uniref:fructose-6-phosphate aldolase n=1 Tax=Dethiobacter alkaliphilus TaxID=427926 RepID=UPI002225DF81|nr:fructose-6-phosphate aldolase [Dethiobacter alkaliphilus]MCW3488893.1 fructose-6-phosphate aldolase [Dethiobacter alkaliphilus]
MKLFLDTANLQEIEQAMDWGVIDGVTTNPTLVAKEGGDFKALLKEICRMVPGPVSAEVMGTKANEMVQEAQELAAVGSQVVIKVPMTPHGLQAVVELKKQGIRTNVTLVFSANQALLAAKAGAAFVSPFLGRLDDLGHDGVSLVDEVCEIFAGYALESEVIAASIRHPLHVIQVAKVGSHIATIPFAVLKQMFKHPMTDLGIERFLADWARANQGK